MRFRVVYPLLATFLLAIVSVAASPLPANSPLSLAQVKEQGAQIWVGLRKDRSWLRKDADVEVRKSSEPAIVFSGKFGTQGFTYVNSEVIIAEVKNDPQTNLPDPHFYEELPLVLSSGSLHRPDIFQILKSVPKLSTETKMPVEDSVDYSTVVLWFLVAFRDCVYDISDRNKREYTIWTSQHKPPGLLNAVEIIDRIRDTPSAGHVLPPARNAPPLAGNAPAAGNPHERSSFQPWTRY
ncbi:hypothetical protein F5878DRAFT_404135 [Lentinula raphanica]|uniref:Uncharacterized protein n=1 Tax=Lentinula raphanica TaxID=153919 RepID=A0AA38PGK5_9AGAR|nr:hypothetical protein F5878DRAFT_404135 [Lentinula raphanica]